LYQTATAPSIVAPRVASDITQYCCATRSLWHYSAGKYEKGISSTKWNSKEDSRRWI